MHLYQFVSKKIVLCTSIHICKKKKKTEGYMEQKPMLWSTKSNEWINKYTKNHIQRVNGINEMEKNETYEGRLQNGTNSKKQKKTNNQIIRHVNIEMRINALNFILINARSGELVIIYIAINCNHRLKQQYRCFSLVGWFFFVSLIKYVQYSIGTNCIEINAHCRISSSMQFIVRFKNDI